MVERWSSKPYVWVRFLLLLLMFNLKPLLKSKRLNLKTSKKVLTSEFIGKTYQELYKTNSTNVFKS